MRQLSIIAKTESADLRANSSTYLDLSFIFGLLIVGIIFYLSNQPNTKVKKINFSRSDVTQMINIPPTKQPSKKLAPVLPRIPVEATDDDTPVDVQIDQWDKDIFEDIPKNTDNLDDEISWINLEIKPKIIFQVMPIYPELAIKSGTEGTVFVQFLQDENGLPTEIKVLKGHPLLQDAAVEAISKYRFSIAEQNGRKVKVRWNIPIRFKLNN